MRNEKRPALRGPHTREDADRRRRQYKAPKKHEQSTAKALGGRRQKGSGSCYDAKGDVACVESGCFDFHGECKTTEGQSLRLEALWLNKITSEAADLLKFPFLAIRFRQRVLDELTSKMWRKLGKPITTAEKDWIAVPRGVFVKMLEAVGESEQSDMWRED